MSSSSSSSATEPPSKRQKLENKPAIASAFAAAFSSSSSHADTAASSPLTKMQQLEIMNQINDVAEAAVEAAEKKRRATEERQKKEQKERIEREKKLKEEADELRAKNALIVSVYSDEMKLRIREHLITSDDIGMPNVLADLILEYTHHPILQLWESIEAECQSHDPQRIECGDKSFIEFYSRGASDPDSLAVPPTEINELESNLRIKLNDPSFALPNDLKILWSIRDGFSSVECDNWGHLKSTDQCLLGSTLFPSLQLVSLNTSPGMSSLHASYCIFDACGDGDVCILKYHLREGCITSFGVDDQFGNEHNATVMPSASDREAAAREQMDAIPPRIDWHSLRHYLSCLLEKLKRHPAQNIPKSLWDDPPTFSHTQLYPADDCDENEENKEKDAQDDVDDERGEKSKRLKSRGHFSSDELDSILDTLTWQLELPIMCEVLSLLADPEDHQSVVQTYYEKCAEDHGCRLGRAA